LCKKVFRRQIAFKAIPLRAIRIGDDDGRRPLCTEALEAVLVFFYMDLDGDKPFVNKRTDTLVRIDLGIQPSTCPSHRRGAEIEQYGPPGLRGALQPRVDVFFPLHSHDHSSL
jgi:hypothetical protein